MKLVYKDSLRVLKKLRIESPKKFSEMLLQLEDMASGSNGGVFFSSGNQFIVRDHYYSNWKDEDFSRLILEVTRDEKKQ